MEQLQDILDRLDVPQSLLIGLVIAAIYFFMPGCYDDGTDLTKKIKEANAQIQKNIEDKKRVQQAIETFKRFKETQANLGSKFDRLIKYIPNDFKTVEQMNIISSEAKAAGASLQSLTDAGMGNRYQFYEEILVEVALTGSYSQLVLFLANLTNTNKVMVLKEMQLNAISVNLQEVQDLESLATVKFTGTFIGYRYRDDKEEGNMQ